MGAIAEKIRQYYETPQNLSDLTSKQALFLQGLRDTGIVLRACERADITRQLAYIWRSAYPEFKDKWDDALEDPIDRVEETLFNMAVSGNNVTATLSYLKHNRAKYREETRIIVAREVDETIDRAIAAHQLPTALEPGEMIETTATVSDCLPVDDQVLGQPE